MKLQRGRVLILGCLVLLLAGCVSVGQEFPTPTAETIRGGITTKTELRKLFGSPTQVGIEDGDPTWTWVYVQAGGFRQTLSKELHVKFTKQDVVKSYNYTSNLPEEVQRQTR